MGYVKGRETRTAYYRIKSKYTGIYNLESILIRKRDIIDRIPIEFYVGIPLPSNEVERKPSTNAPYTITVQLSDSQLLFCPNCGKEFERDTKICENCGTIIIEE